MKTRIIAGLALVPLLLLVILGGIPLYIGEFVIVAIAINEFYKAFKEKDINPIFSLGYIFAFYLFIKNCFGLEMNYTYIVIFILFICSIIPMLKCKKNIMDIVVTFFGIFYVEILLDFIVLIINNFPDGHKLVWLVFIIAFMTDTFAYFSGYLFGKHKLIPNVSPKKTIEGSIGGIFGSTICCLIFGYIFNLNIVWMLVLGSIGSIIAQIGDLFASSIKRYVGIKDYGNLIPGHGGVLDRFDSVILVAPFVYSAIILFIK
ncbi:MAG: phosphatidate cytidylyltransferase [Intestinibacter sp.]|uniref:phosphatidate cytidylyltransferase n=1 Tax=Intestinibacter sp. TaxID=1965304 RepID=UPI003F18FBE0